jgi:hypothetical protein
MASLLTAALARAQSFLLEPSAPRAATPASVTSTAFDDRIAADSIEVAVLGARPRCGATTVARGLAAALALPGVRPAHVIALDRSPTAAHSLEIAGGGSGWEVPAALADGAEVAEYGAMVSRLAGRPAAIVWDVAASEVGRAHALACAADVVVAVVVGESEPALGELLGEMLGARFGRVLVVANRADPDRWRRRTAACLPDSRLGALLAGRGRRAGGALGGALAELAALVDP